MWETDILTACPGPGTVNIGGPDKIPSLALQCQDGRVV